MTKLAVISSHPIQYNAPFFKMLHERNNIEIKVFYTWSQSEGGSKYDPGFGKSITWDIPLLAGYNYTFVKNISKNPGSHHYKGIDNPTLKNEIVEWGAKAVMIYGWNFKSHFKIIRLLKNKIPILFRGDSTLLDETSGVKKYIRRLVLKFVYSYVDYALYPGNANKEYFLKHGLKERQLFFMPHAVDNSRFKGTTNRIEEVAAYKESLQISKEAFVFLFVGKLESKKQPDFLINAFLSVKDKNSFLLIAGSGHLEQSLKSRFANNSNIIFLGFQNQEKMPLIYAMCDVFVLPSKGPGETWGLAINEAMASGKAVIASDACGASYNLIQLNVNGFIFANKDTKMLQSQLTYFINNKETAGLMGEKSLAIIADYCYTNQCITVESILLNESQIVE
jgi:glycosyltransferase involved in cell wall biosynthesis